MISTLLRFLRCAAATLALFAPLVHAGLPFNDGDVLLSFRASGGDGSSTCYLVRLGSAMLFTGATGQFTVNLGNIKTDLEATYGVDWKTRDDVFWSVCGVQKAAGNGFSTNTMFATRAETAPGTQSTAWTRPSTFAAGGPAGRIQSMASVQGSPTGYGAGTTANQVISTNNAAALLQATNADNSYSSYQPGGSNTTGSTAFGYFASATAIEGTFANGTAGSVLDFYTVAPGSGLAALAGAFRLDNNGNLTFSKDISVFAPPATVGIELGSYQVNEDIAGGQLAINLVRTGNAGTAFTVNFSTTDGTAVAGTDFTGQTNVAVSFAANDTNKTVNVAIARRTGFQGGRQFGVALSNPTGNVSLGTIKTATVGIVEVDPAPPSVAFTTAGFSVNEDAGPVVVTLARSGDATAAFTVNFSTTDGTALAGTDFTGQTNMSVSFAANETSKSVNVAVVHRADFQGGRAFNVALSSPNGATLGGPSSATVTINEVDPQPSTLVFGGATASVAENAAGGTVPIVINRTGATTGAGSVVFSTADGTALAGTDYTAKTKAIVSFAANETTKTVDVAVLDRAGFQPSRQFTVVLSNPTNGGVLGATATATVTITDKDQQVSGAVAGTYHGLIASVGAASHETTGSIALTVTVKGAFTGRVHLGGGSLVFSGKFEAGGAAKFNPGPAETLKLKILCTMPMDLGTLTLRIAGDTISGETKNPGVTGLVHAERDAFDGKTPQTTVDATFLANGGFYTAVLPSKAQAVLVAGALPQGDGTGFARVNKSGGVLFTGVLADGAPFSATGVLSKNYTCPIFTDLYVGGGLLAGTLSFKVQANSDFAGADFLWIRPLRARAAYYPAGWLAGVKLDVLGASYAVPPARPAMSVFPGLGAVSSVNGNAKIAFSDGKLTALISKSINISPTNLITAVPATDGNIAIAIRPISGLTLGSFRHSDGTRPAFRAVILQKGANRGAFGYFLNAVPRGLTTGESGGVSVTAK